MIDTVRLKLRASGLKNPESSAWEVKQGSNVSIHDGAVVDYTGYTHKETGLRVFGHSGIVETLEVSLPRLAYGSNGILLKPQDVNPAYRAALDLACDVVQEPVATDITRYDLVHHFQGLMCEFIASLRGLKHRRVRRKCVEFFETGLEWPGKNVHIRLYDKLMEMEKRPGLIQRLEFQLRGDALRLVWDSGRGFDVKACYGHYRALAGQFQSRSIPRIGSVADLLSFLKRNDVKVNGIDPVQRFLDSRSRSTRYRLEKDLNSVRLEFFEANFTSFLPECFEDLVFLDCVSEGGDQAAPLAVPGRLSA